MAFDGETETVVASLQTCYRNLVLHKHPAPATPDEAHAGLVAAARRMPDRAFNLDKSAKQLLARLRFVAHYMPELDLPTFEELRTAGAPAGPVGCIIEAACVGQRSFAGLRKVDMLGLIRTFVGHQMTQLNRLAPARVDLPSGRSAALRYEHDQAILAARIQHLFGVHATPPLVQSRSSIVVHLLAPNGLRAPRA